jgi:hypothetical protein
MPSAASAFVNTALDSERSAATQYRTGYARKWLCLLKVTYRYLTGGSEENHETPIPNGGASFECLQEPRVSSFNYLLFFPSSLVRPQSSSYWPIM